MEVSFLRCLKRSDTPAREVLIGNIRLRCRVPYCQLVKTYHLPSRGSFSRPITAFLVGHEWFVSTFAGRNNPQRRRQVLACVLVSVSELLAKHYRTIEVLRHWTESIQGLVERLVRVGEGNLFFKATT